MTLGNQFRVMNLSSGLRTEFGILLPPGGQVAAYVRSTGPQTGDDMDIRQRLLPTLNAALARVQRPGDMVIVLPGHAENISAADHMSSLVAGTQIIGVGAGNLRPTFTWSAATATFLLDVANVSLSNCILEMAGDPASTTALSVAAPITVSGAGCAITNCKIRTSVDADQLATIPVTTTAAGDDFVFENNYVYGATTGENTTVLRLVGADRASIRGNLITAATSAVAIGVIQFITTDSTDVVILDNYLRNNKAASTAAVTVSAGATSSSGFVDRLTMTVLADAANQLVLGNAVGAWAASVAAFTFGRFVNVANLAGERAAEVTVVSA